jgi:hypothetical protein
MAIVAVVRLAKGIFEQSDADKSSTYRTRQAHILPGAAVRAQ